jgi:two-component system chemotaxis response regulator CheB
MIKVLVVDDSAFMRKTLSRMLETDESITVVGTAGDGREAVEKVALLKPDVVTLDVEMPVMTGLEALKIIMANNPLPVIMFSALTKEGADITMEALSIGASDFMTKDFSNFSLQVVNKENELVSKVKNVARKKVQFLLKRLEIQRKPIALSAGSRVKHEVLSIGASTGGPPALQSILAALPENFPLPIVIAQHMPKLFTQSFAQRLNAVAKIEVKEAEDREPLRPGKVLIAPGDVHMAVRRKGNEVSVELTSEKKYIYRPSVDLLMQSVGESYGSRAIGVILTGMGNDGLVGVTLLKQKGGYVIAQDEETCVVYGMPRAVVNARLTDAVVPIDRVPDEIMRVL